MYGIYENAFDIGKMWASGENVNFEKKWQNVKKIFSLKNFFPHEIATPNPPLSSRIDEIVLDVFHLTLGHFLCGRKRELKGKV